jgi:hypothetical protein
LAIELFDVWEQIREGNEELRFTIWTCEGIGFFCLEENGVGFLHVFLGGTDLDKFKKCVHTVWKL